MSDNGDLQTRIAAYMSRQRTRKVSLDEICRAVNAERGATSLMMSRIVNGEARPYPIVRSGRAQYTWVHDPSDHPANLAVLAEIIGYVTGADHDQAAQLAGIVTRLRDGMLTTALDEAVTALEGDSNDAEHDALWSIGQGLAAVLGVPFDPQ
jgi:hypothetical protein